MNTARIRAGLGLLLAISLIGMVYRAPRVHANAAPAYYIVVQTAGGGGGQSSTITISGGSSMSSVTVSNSSATVDCTRYASADDASAAAADRHAGQSWTVVLAPDALHAMLQATGQPSDLAGTAEVSLADADVCTP